MTSNKSRLTRAYVIPPLLFLLAGRQGLDPLQRHERSSLEVVYSTHISLPLSKVIEMLATGYATSPPLWGGWERPPRCSVGLPSTNNARIGHATHSRDPTHTSSPAGTLPTIGLPVTNQDSRTIENSKTISCFSKFASIILPYLPYIHIPHLHHSMKNFISLALLVITVLFSVGCKKDKKSGPLTLKDYNAKMSRTHYWVGALTTSHGVAFAPGTSFWGTYAVDTSYLVTDTFFINAIDSVVSLGTVAMRFTGNDTVSKTFGYSEQIVTGYRSYHSFSLSYYYEKDSMTFYSDDYNYNDHGRTTEKKLHTR